MRAFGTYKICLVMTAFTLLNFFSERPVASQNIKYTVTDLGTFGGLRSVAFSINNSGQVVGNADTSLNETHAFLYEAGTLIDLGTLGGKESYAYHISDSCFIVGRSQNRRGFYRAFITTCATDSPLFDLSSLDPLLDGSYSTVSGVNKAGQAVGYTATEAAANHERGVRSRPFIFSNNRITDLGTLGGEESIATAINDAEQIVGYISKSPHGAYAEHRGYRYDRGTISDLGTLGGRTATPTDINGSGNVVGYAQTTGGEPHAFIYSGDTLQDLGTFPGGTQSLGFGITNAGDVVGTADTSTGVLHAFFYSKGRMQDLNELIPPNSGWTLTEARSINESGQIVGNGIIKGQQHGFLLTPVGDQAARKAQPRMIPSARNLAVKRAER
jgi:probable HAF family extracellular repeat protein